MNLRFMVWIGELIVREWLDYSKGIRVNECKIYDVDRGIRMNRWWFYCSEREWSDYSKCLRVNECRIYDVDRGIDS